MNHQRIDRLAPGARVLDAFCYDGLFGIRAALGGAREVVCVDQSEPALERALELAKAAGARKAIPLAVSIAAHSPLMDIIQADWNVAVDAAGFSDAHTPVVGNVHAKPISSAAELRADVMAQMQSRVRWVESVRFMASQGVTTLIELGSGGVLAGLVKRIEADVPTLPLGSPQDFAAL